MHPWAFTGRGRVWEIQPRAAFAICADNGHARYLLLRVGSMEYVWYSGERLWIEIGRRRFSR
jgi:hypothetical protein